MQLRNGGNVLIDREMQSANRNCTIVSNRNILAGKYHAVILKTCWYNRVQVPDSIVFVLSKPTTLQLISHVCLGTAQIKFQQMFPVIIV